MRGRGGCDYYLLDVLPSNVCFIYLTFGTEGPSSRFVCQGPILTSQHTACLWGVRLSAWVSPSLPSAGGLLQAFVFQIHTHTHYLPAVQSENSLCAAEGRREA